MTNGKNVNKQVDNRPEPVFYPVPTTYINQIKKQQTNFSLCFNRMVNWKYNESSVKKDGNNASNLADIAIQHIPFTKNDLKKIQERQKDYIKEMTSYNLQTIEVYAKTTAPFITGLGSGHPTETGMILDRNTGVPYVPASSIKGVLRLAYAVNIANGRDSIPDNELNTYFGSTDDSSPQKGQVSFLDAYPINPPVIKCDIMNPHFSKYYNSENNAPIEKENPTPIKFISVEKNTVFCFRCVLNPLKNQKITSEDMQAVYKAFETAFSTVGFGGKTSIGYGRFKIVTEEEAHTAIITQSSNIQSNTVSPNHAPKNGEIYSVRLVEQNKKGTWKVEMCDFPVYTGSISNSSSMPEKKEGDIINVKVTAAKPGNSVFQYSEEIK